MSGTPMFGQWPQASTIVASGFCDGNNPPAISKQGGLLAITSAARIATGQFRLLIDTTKTGALADLNILVTPQTLPLDPNVKCAVSIFDATHIDVSVNNNAAPPVGIDAPFYISLSRR